MKRTGFSRLTPWLAALPIVAVTLTTAAAQQPSVRVDDDDITIRGCVGPGGPSAAGDPVLVWTRGDLMLRNAAAAGTGQLTERVFYWLEDEDDLAPHVGQLVEVKGELGDFEKGEIEIKRDGDFTNIELKLDGKKEKARVPTAWFGAPRSEGEFDIVARKIDVDDVKVLGACPAR